MHNTLCEADRAVVPVYPTRRRAQPTTEPLWRRIHRLLSTWDKRARQRHQLRELDDRMLKDIGASRVDVEREIRKPFWRG